MADGVEGSILEVLKGEQLSSVTFVQDYLQLHFGGPYINAYVWPSVALESETIRYGMSNYRDVFCGQITKIVRETKESDSELSLFFTDRSAIKISLGMEDRRGPEAAMMQVDSGRRWMVW